MLYNPPAATGESSAVYRALLTQTGSDAPVVTVLENSLGGTPVWSRSSDGIYFATLTGAFPAGKSWGIATGFNPFTPGTYGLARNSDDQMILRNLNELDGNTVSLEIRVYP